MNAAEIKLDLIQRLDKLSETELEMLYDKFLALLSTTSRYTLSEAENAAIDQALEASESRKPYTHDEVVEESKLKYPNLKFK